MAKEQNSFFILGETIYANDMTYQVFNDVHAWNATKVDGEYKGYDVTYCRNVTDVDDKILKKAEKEYKKASPPNNVNLFFEINLNSR